MRVLKSLNALAAIFAGMSSEHVREIGGGFRGFGAPRRAGPKPEGGAGAARARKRLAAKEKANEAIPSAYRMTRQQARAHDRKIAKMKRVKPAEFARRKMKAING